MIQRIVYLKLKDTYCGSLDIEAITAQSVDVFEQTELITQYSVGRPSDAHTGRACQLMFSLTFREQADVDAWRMHPLRRCEQ